MILSKNIKIISVRDKYKGNNIENKDKKKKETRKFIVRIIFIAFIVHVWTKKDVMAILATMPKEQIIPHIATYLAFYLIAIGSIAGGIWLIKWIVCKMKKK